MKDAAKNSSVLARTTVEESLVYFRSEIGNVVQWKHEMSK